MLRSSAKSLVKFVNRKRSIFVNKIWLLQVIPVGQEYFSILSTTHQCVICNAIKGKIVISYNIEPLSACQTSDQLGFVFQVTANDFFNL